jgi:hypothetical protein
MPNRIKDIYALFAALALLLALMLSPEARAVAYAGFTDPIVSVAPDASDEPEPCA